jgi:hypothetical protein
MKFKKLFASFRDPSRSVEAVLRRRPPFPRESRQDVDRKGPPQDAQVSGLRLEDRRWPQD